MAQAGRILSIGDDDSLRISRDLLLRTDGFEVVSVTSLEMLKEPSQGRFDAAVISQTVTGPRAVQLTRILRQQYPGIRILRIREQRTEVDPVCDLEFEALSGPNEFLAAVRKLCAPIRSSAGPRTTPTTAS